MLDAAPVIDPLLDLESEPPGNQRRRFAPANVVEDGHPQTADLEHVAKALRGDERDPCALAFENSVRRHGRPVHDLRDLGDPYAAIADDGLETGCDTQAVVLRRRQHLGAQHPSCGVQAYEVGERAADIDADPRFHQWLTVGDDAIDARTSSPMRSAALLPRISSFSSVLRKLQCFLT